MRNYHFPHMRKAIALAVALMGGLLSVIMGTGAGSAVQNIRDDVELAGYVPYDWFTAENVGRLWWLPLLVCVGPLLWGFMPRRKPIPPALVDPFLITARLFDWNYREGTMIEGIEWKDGYSHSTITVINRSDTTIENVAFFLGPDKPIIDSAVDAPFADVRIGPPYEVPRMVAFSYLPDTGGYEAVPLLPEEKGILIAPGHRVQCERFPPGVAITITLATVTAIAELTADLSGGLFNKERIDSKGISVTTTYERNGETVHWVKDIPFSAENTATMPPPSPPAAAS